MAGSGRPLRDSAARSRALRSHPTGSAIVIASLADAWHWYQRARLLAQTMERLGKNHWNNLPWEGDLGRDSHLKNLTSENIIDGSNTILDDLDDLCVLLLFSVFEATIRDRVLADVEAELPPLQHLAIKRALEER